MKCTQGCTVLLIFTLSICFADHLLSITRFAQCQKDNLGHVTLLGSELNVWKCAAYCVQKSWCQGLVFAMRWAMCGLYSNMTSWQDWKGDVGDCAIIRKNDISDMRFPDFQLKDLKECPEFGDVTNGHVLGNLNLEGNRKQVICDDGYVIQEGRDLSQCVDGLWTRKPVCVKKPSSNQAGDCYGGYQLYGTTCYTLFASTYSYPTAVTRCTSGGGTMLTMDTADDEAFVASRTGSNAMWVNILLNGTEWTNPLTWEIVTPRWCPDEPTMDTETCLAVLQHAIGHCNQDIDCRNPSMNIDTVCKQPRN